MRACTLAAQKEDEDGTGFSHTLTSLHESYLERFEATCEWAIEVEGGDPKEFFAACQVKLVRTSVVTLCENILQTLPNFDCCRLPRP